MARERARVRHRIRRASEKSNDSSEPVDVDDGSSQTGLATLAEDGDDNSELGSSLSNSTSSNGIRRRRLVTREIFGDEATVGRIVSITLILLS